MLLLSPTSSLRDSSDIHKISLPSKKLMIHIKPVLLACLACCNSILLRMQCIPYDAHGARSARRRHRSYNTSTQPIPLHVSVIKKAVPLKVVSGAFLHDAASPLGTTPYISGFIAGWAIFLCHGNHRICAVGGSLFRCTASDEQCKRGQNYNGCTHYALLQLL
jgi:hypothetical protein